jgi:hypothetical protein
MLVAVGDDGSKAAIWEIDGLDGLAGRFQNFAQRKIDRFKMRVE